MLQNRLFLRHFIANFATSSAFEPREFENNEKTAITAVNALTNARSIVQITSKEKVGKRFRREFNLPQKAIDGLRNAIITCERPAKQLQNEADQLAKKLEQRRFPESPEKLKKLRDEVKRKLKSGKKDEISDFDKESFGGKVQEAQQYEIRNEVDRIMKKENFNWKPLEITTKESAAAYSLARLAPNYAEITRTLEEFNTIPDFQPETVLDFGSGAGAGFWAIQNKWPDVKEITMVDLSDAMMKFSMDSLRNEQSSEASQNGRPFVHNNVNFRRHLIPSLNTTYDVVLAHRVLCEIGSSETRLQLIESLWKRTNRFLILIESSQTGAFGGLLEARDFLLTQGTLVDYRKLLKSLEEAVMLSPKVVRIVEDYNLSDYEKYALLMEAVPPGHTVPTMLPTATVLAPCPHDLGCPLGVHSSCTFNTRFQPIRADGRRSEKESDGTEVSKFTYMILEKSQRKVNNEHTERILKNRKLGGHVTCDVCTAFRGIQRITLSKKHGEMYTAFFFQLRSRRDGDLLPINLKTMTSSGIFEVDN
ncbi:Methyltransferase-like protein 17, mitochondrial [Caenorhabditis elegans]|uniref:Methyltransferase-like protein 17, mitochondrial n=1 Tax=Caenorhabditis elegans TaxID=6239 RepID=A0A8D9I604_CAEEL|nr:Methyltransferase-like protein 17, mitochondrial [Caenorhabditis elegans]CAG8860229.1 Methyltransferase-like protein 17, mitochondrial [Caenorhabditis elegans]